MFIQSCDRLSSSPCPSSSGPSSSGPSSSGPSSSGPSSSGRESGPRGSAPPPYAELHCLSAFTFLRGASQPEELVERAAALGYEALALTDECSLAGVVRAHLAAREHGIRLIVGSELALQGGLRLVLLAADREGYGNLSALITEARRRAPKGRYELTAGDLEDGKGRGLDGCLALLLPEIALEHGPRPSTRLRAQARWLATRFPARAWIAVELFRRPGDRERLRALEYLGAESGLPLVASADVHMHTRSRRALQDLLSAVRLGTTVAGARPALFPNGERHLRPREVLGRLYPRALLEETLAVARRCTFSLEALRYEYPRELVPSGTTPERHLRTLVEAGMRSRWPQGVPPGVRGQIEHELALISELRYEPYFLTVHDLVRFARSRGILCQGRGSAANSAVCYCLGITEVDPGRMATLFERFISRERNEPPDIDVDFEHERREEVIQYLYDKYGRERAALAATVICYRPRSAIRDVGKALGLSLSQVDRLAKSVAWWDGRQVVPQRIREAGLDPESPVVRRLCALVSVLIGFPRHLSQHVGGFVISEGALSRLVPVENAAMAGRTVIQWDKDDLEALGLLKVDVLALGMLSAIHKAFDLVAAWRGRTLTLATVPPEDPAVYEMIGRADTIGVFQIESRAQMAMLPRLRPRTFYDLVIEVAIVRPGPIQGGMVHPYLRRRQGREPVTYPSEAVRSVLERTLGVPIFQEQVMQLAVVAAGFTPGEADALRRAMAAWRRKGGLGPFEERLVRGMRERGYPEPFARQIFQQIQGFGEYGFPESHAASFALLVYVSAWLKCHEPAAFACALLNSQPMGFYAPAQLIGDARRHGVEVRPVDVQASEWDSTLEPPDPRPPAAALERLPLREEAARGQALPPPTSRGRWGPPGAECPGGDGAVGRLEEGALCPATGREKGGREEQRGEEGEPVGGAGEVEPPPGTREGRFPGAGAGIGAASAKGAGEGAGAESGRGQPALRLGLRMVKGLSRAAGARIVAARREAPFRSVADLARRAQLDRGSLECLVRSGALAGVAGHRHRARWAALGAEPLPGMLSSSEPAESEQERRPALPPPSELEDLAADYGSLGLTLGRHPVALLRERLEALGARTASVLQTLPGGAPVRAAGLVVGRQRPSTASGVIFMTLEDETGFVNVVVWPWVAERQRAALLASKLVEVRGVIERDGEVVHLIAGQLVDRSAWLGALDAPSRDFH